jgi:hypothetical protein
VPPARVCGNSHISTPAATTTAARVGHDAGRRRVQSERAALTRPRSAGDVTTAALDAPGGRAVFTGVLVGWIVLAAAILRHRVYVSHDSMSNYAHVWYVATRLRHGHGIPLRMPQLARGQAYAFPYAFVPWLSAAVAWLALGEWSVTLWLVVGGVALGVAFLWALPELGRGWWAAAAVANPVFVLSVIGGQIPFLWGAALLVFGVGCWRHDRRVAATILVALGQATHPAIVGPLALTIVLAWIHWERDRRALALHYLVAVVLTIPAALVILASPVTRDTSTATALWEFVITFDVRFFVVAVPVALVLLARLNRPQLAPIAFTVLLALNVVLMGPLDSRYAWGALSRQPSRDALDFLSSPQFEPAATYRLLRAGDGKVAMYQLVRAGGRLDSEMFPESINERSFRDVDEYALFLRDRRVDVVWLWSSYDTSFHTNEHALLDRLAADSSACARGLVGVRVLRGTGQYSVYQIDRACPATG